jgi:arylsulfatase A-like enzyme/Tfp pilus assembly protein PilF
LKAVNAAVKAKVLIKSLEGTQFALSMTHRYKHLQKNSFRWISVGTIAILFTIAAVAGRSLLSRRPVRTDSGTVLGRLPGGVSRSDLNVLVITLDTTRADRLGAYGYAGIATPNLDRLAREGVLFEQAATTAPLTLPAHSSLFTSKFPPEHGVRDNGGFFLDPRETTMAEVLKDRGFKTGAFIGAYVLDSKWGLNQGFDTYFDDFDLSKYKAISLGAIQRPGNEVVDHGLQWLDSIGSERFFGWMHLYDAHSPYEPPEPYKTIYQGRPYIGEIAFVDSQVGRVLTYLDTHKLADHTIVVVMGDHGESLHEHGEATHGFFIYESTVHVPLIVRAPFSEMQGRRVGEVVRSVDVMPTVLDMLGIAAPAGIEGVSVAPLMTGAKKELGLESYSEALYPLHHFGWSDLRAMRAGRYKLIASPRPELYDLQDDPGEHHDLFAQREALGTRMLERLRQREARFSKPDESQKQAMEVDPDARARLAALGYVGTFVTTAVPDESRTGLADPKDKVGLFNKITTARDISKDDAAFDEVITTLKEVIREDPKVIDAWFMLGNMYAKVGRQQDAIPYFKQALALKPDDDMAVVNLANAYRQIGRDEEALVGFKRFLELDPKNSQVRYSLAEILLDRGDLNGAEAQLRQAIALEPKLVAARNALGVVALKRGDVSMAEREIRAALAEKADVRLAHFNLALVAEERGRAEEAIAEYRREIELHPAASYKAWFNLGKLYGHAGNRPGEEDAFKHAVEANPSFAEGYLYLAKLYLDEGRNFDEAVRLARKGIEAGPDSEYAPLGYYVIADIYSRQGKHAQAEQEAARGRALESAQRRTK